MSRSAHRITLVASVVGALACENGDADRGGAIAPSPAERLVGVWEVAFHLDRPVQILSPPSTREVRGTVALIQNHHRRTSFRELARALHYGVYDVGFGPLGFDPWVRDQVPTAVGRIRAESVDMRAASGGGHFIMRRQR